jgi:predicted Ser/Thr protein kinase
MNNNPKNCRVANKFYASKTKELIGEGADGKIYKQCGKKSCIAIKTQLRLEERDIEYNINKRVYSLCPTHIIRPYNMYKCRKQSLIFMEYLKGTEAKKYTNGRNFRRILREVLETLRDIAAKEPTFRHNDLHGGNVMVRKDGRPFIIDFGYANIQKPGYKNPVVQNIKHAGSDGIAPNNHPLYDAHLFINSLYSLKNPSINKHLVKLLPKEYFGQVTSKVYNFRMRIDGDHRSLPCLDHIIFLLKNINEQKPA